ncbi:MAG: tetratricopeptide repeat protein [Verrucomicrobia bacterium]|nr:tetratricopeptide repeat protein [Verrucomicrobiota bacterium]
MMFHPFHSRFGSSLALLLSVCMGTASQLEQARKALDEGVAEVAIVQLQQQLAAANLPPETRRQAKITLAEALFAAGRTEEALQQASDPEVKAPLLEGRIQAAAGNWNAALTLFETAGNDLQAITGKAECLRSLGRLPEAIAALESIAAAGPACVALRLGEFHLEQNQRDQCRRVLTGIRAPLTVAERKWKQYLEARLLLAQNKPTEAYERFETLQLDPRHVTGAMVVGATLGMTDSRTELTGLTAADDIIEQYIWKHPESPSLAALFHKLDEVYGGEENPSLGELQKWSQREPALRAGFATFYLAKSLARDGKPEPALAALENFATRFPQHLLLPEALLMQGRLLANDGKFDAAQKALDDALRAAPQPDLRAEIEMASASAHFKAGEFVLAATIFRSAGEHCPALAERARFNTALSWLHQGNYARFGQEYQEFSQLFPQSPLRPDLILEEGLLRTRQDDPKAEAALQQFIRTFPDNPRVPEAWLTLAERRHARQDPAGATAFLKVVNTSPLTTQTAEQSDYLAIFVADAANPPADDKVIALCRAFIERHPTSQRLPEVRMKMGQVFFRNGDFASAQTQFETLALETPASPLVEAALFLAAQASTKRIDAAGMDRAIELFGDVATRNGPLALHARLQLAALQNRLGKEGDAVKLYDDILRANPGTEIKAAALAGKADNLLALGARDKTLVEQALAVYEQLASEPGIDATAQHRALYNKGRCMEKLERPEEALAAYYEVVESGVAKPQEYFWFYKAGFDACRLSESRQQWKSAIAIYQKMAALEGPRAEEAKARMTQLRLEHFIWE